MAILTSNLSATKRHYMSVYKLIAVYGIDSTDASKSEYLYPVYFIFDSSSDTLLNHSFNNAAEALSYIYQIDKSISTISSETFSPPNKFNLEIINVIYTPNNKHFFSPNNHLPTVIHDSLSDSIKEFFFKNGYKI